MDITEFLALYDKSQTVEELKKWSGSRDSLRLRIKGVKGSLPATVISAYYKQNGGRLCMLENDEETAAYLYHDLCQLLGSESADNVYFLPSSYKRAIKYGEKDASSVTMRNETLQSIQTKENSIFVTYPKAAAEKVISGKSLQAKTLTLSVGQRIKLSAVSMQLLSFGFERQDFVYEPGQFSIRGSIVDVYSYASEYPFRIDFFGDEIDTIRTFGVESQLSIEQKKKISIVSEVNESGADAVCLLDFIDEDTIMCIDDYETFLAGIDGTIAESNGAENFISEGEWPEKIDKKKIIEKGLHSHYRKHDTIEYESSLQPVFNKNFDIVADNILEMRGKAYDIYVMSDNTHQTDRLKEILDSKNPEAKFKAVKNTLHQGFIDHELRICAYTDHQIFDRFHKYTLSSDKARQDHASVMLKTLQDMQIGDYIAHIDYGIGKFGGLMTMDMNGHKQEVIKLIYKDDDLVFITIQSLHKISKYKPKEGEAPRLNKLGTGAWQSLKERTKKKVKDIARDLILLYSRRREEKGFAYSPDSFMQSELESSFLYEDTPDQTKATIDVKRDMEKEQPMDRLVCGDVGFGKTEVAMRAAFKAVADNKQVAVLVPTTVLAFQHYQTFSERLRNFPCKVDYLCRTRSAKDIKKTLAGLADGSVNIIIGTHKLIGKSVKFKDLGLLIVDEEQKFGVSVKEKIRQMKVNIDTLTLTATPIPRTLQFSLMGARDLSVIKTPPPNRYPVQTELHTFDADIIRDAIKFELDRNGQVFFVNNRIDSLPAIKSLINQLVPEARVVIGHGRMAGEELEKVILDFLNYDYDILLSTSIIESGIDISNCNTIIVNDAQNFGLSDLHQLRGRVGRSNRKAFCYLLSPPLSSLPDDSRRRLETIETFAELGSGFNIAMQDLDIRGAGNLLGAEQSGFIADLGYETYYKILNEAVAELKENELVNLTIDEKKKEEEQVFVYDCQIETDMELMIPADYVENVAERMNMYRELDAVKDEKEMQSFLGKLEDRFGKLPEQVNRLADLVRLRWYSISLGFDRCVLKNGRMTMYFNSANQAYLFSDVFSDALAYAQSRPGFSFQDKKGTGSYLKLEHVSTLEEALKIQKSMLGEKPLVAAKSAFL